MDQIYVISSGWCSIEIAAPLVWNAFQRGYFYQLKKLIDREEDREVTTTQ
jgi:hypothetical protein